LIQIPKHPWDTVYVDFLGPFPSGELLLVVIDGRTRFPEVEIVKSTSASSTIPRLDRIFSTHGLPKKIITDNGPPFTSYEIQKFMNDNKIHHHKITPLWPQGNAEAENFMKPLKKCIQAAHVDHKNWRKEMYQFLLNYRSTPHSTTTVPPATALFGRSIRNKLPSVTETLPDMKYINETIDTADQNAKCKRNEYADKRRHARIPQLAVGDCVLVRQEKQNKLTPQFDPNPYTITAVKGTMITATRADHCITRNSSHFKSFTGSATNQGETSDNKVKGRNENARERERNVVVENRDEGRRQYPRRQRKRPEFFHDGQR
jgi:hypothetical protein